MIILYPLAMGPVSSSSSSSPSWIPVLVPVCTLTDKKLGRADSGSASSVFILYSCWFYNHVTMDKRRVASSPRDIQQGKIFLFSFLMLCIYIFFHFGGFCKKRALYCLTIVLFELPPPPLSLSSPPSLLRPWAVTPEEGRRLFVFVFITEDPSSVLLFLFSLFIFICN